MSEHVTFDVDAWRNFNQLQSLGLQLEYAAPRSVTYSTD
jgi:hypothetical protein